MPATKEAPSANPPLKEGKAAVFAKRLGSTLGLWVLVGGALVWGNMWLLFGLLGALSLLGLREYYRMIGDGVDGVLKVVTTVVSLGYLVVAYRHCAVEENGAFFYADVVGLAVLVSLLFAGVMRKPLEGRKTFDGIAEGVFGFVWVVFLFNFVTRLLFVPELNDDGSVGGVVYLLYVVAVTKFTDMGAYAIGTCIGKHKMVPHISPGKTWQGFGGGILGAAVASFGLVAIFPEQLGELRWFHAGVLAVLIGIVAVFGDLVESVVKRCLGAKDSGQVFPGIGGVMDLIDSLCFTAPVMYFYLKWVIGV